MESVWVVKGVVEYEGCSILAVCKTDTLAYIQRDVIYSHGTFYDNIVVEEWKVQEEVDETGSII